jgi:hypothetical protein
MNDGKPNSKSSEPQSRRAPAGRRGAGAGRQRGYVEQRGTFIERATAEQGHSGHGSESVRPHLRDQLRLKALLPTPFPMPDNDRPGKDDHHR